MVTIRERGIQYLHRVQGIEFYIMLIVILALGALSFGVVAIAMVHENARLRLTLEEEGAKPCTIWCRAKRGEQNLPSPLSRPAADHSSMYPAPSARATSNEAGDPRYDKPPIIVLSEAQGYSFPSGSAELNEHFQKRLSEVVVRKLLETATRYGLDTIEVIGHTDEVPVKASRQGNLDGELIAALRQHPTETVLHAADNVGLGMARAVAVAAFLLKDERLKQFRLVVYSAGHVVLPTGTLSDGSDAKANADRRRIEIRLRKS